MRNSARNIHSPRKKIITGVGIMVFVAVEIQASGMQPNYLNTMVTFVTNLAHIGVDNICTGCISNQSQDFKGPMVKSHMAIKAFGRSSTTGIMIGTLVYK